MISATSLRGHKCDLFATKDSVDDALVYAQEMVGGDKGITTIAIMIYHNSLLEALADTAEDNLRKAGYTMPEKPTKEKKDGIS